VLPMDSALLLFGGERCGVGLIYLLFAYYAGLLYVGL
jgi:hypothetical protein